MPEDSAAGSGQAAVAQSSGWTLQQWLKDQLVNVTCDDCGESHHPDDYEYVPVGTGIEAYRCPSCGGLIA